MSRIQFTDKFIFVRLTTPIKFSQDVSVWMEILKEKPDSCLWLLDIHRVAKSNLYQRTEKLGVAEERIILRKVS